jgi:predicted dehydrogenase
MKVGVIGSGSISEYHLRAFQTVPDIEVRGITSIAMDQARDVASRFGIPKIYGNVEELLNDGEIDAVSVAVWNAGHAELTIAALKAGKHVFCEKPMARNASEAAKMIEAEKASGKVLMIGLVRRFDIRSEAALSVVQSGDLGKIYYMKAAYLRRDGQPGGWFTDKAKSGGGALIDVGIHSLDLALYLADAGPVSSVRGTSYKLPDIMQGIKGTQKYLSKENAGVRDVEDMIVATLFFENGAVLNLEASWAQHVKEDSLNLELFGTKGGLKVDPELLLTGNNSDYLADTTFSIHQSENFLDEMFTREMSHFRDCVVDGTPCRCPSSDGLALMKIIDAIYLSAEENREVPVG